MTDDLPKMSPDPQSDPGPAHDAAGEDRKLDFRPGMDMDWEITRSTAETDGERFEAINRIGPRMVGPPVHVHPTADDVFEVLEGTLDFCIDGEWQQVQAGETVVAPAGVPHTLRNSTAEPVKAMNTHRPALQFESFFREMHSLIARGKIKSLPPKEPRSAIYAAMLFAKYPEEIRTTKPPNAVFAALAGVGRLLRFKLEG